MAIKLLEGSITPAEGEVNVRTYYCTNYKSKILGLSAAGYLMVTNKRVVFHAYGNSAAGPSIIQSEIPISDVSGVSSFKGNLFNLGSFFSGLLVGLLVSGIFGAIFSAITRNSSSNAPTIAFPIIGLVAGVIAFFLPRVSIWPTVVVAAGTGIVSTSLINLRRLASSFFSPNPSSGVNVFGILVALALAIYFFWLLSVFARRPTFSLAIGSKGGANTPINISGTSGFSVVNNVAGKALQSAPTSETENMLKEIGALILDIQTLGDHGITKWKRE